MYPDTYSLLNAKLSHCASNMVKCGWLMYEEIGEAFDYELEEDRDE